MDTRAKENVKSKQDAITPPKLVTFKNFLKTRGSRVDPTEDSLKTWKKVKGVMADAEKDTKMEKDPRNKGPKNPVQWDEEREDDPKIS